MTKSCREVIVKMYDASWIKVEEKNIVKMRILRHFSFLESSNWAVEKVLPDKFLSGGRLDFVGPLSFDTFHQMCF